MDEETVLIPWREKCRDRDGESRSGSGSAGNHRYNRLRLQGREHLAQYREMPGFPEQVEREDSVKTKQERSKRLEIRERQHHGNQGSSVRDFMDVAQGSDEKEAGVPPQH